jgi:hypothetical protein
MFITFLGKVQRKTPLGRPTQRWKYNIKNEFREIGCQKRSFSSGIIAEFSVHVNKIMKLLVHLGDYQLCNENSVPKICKDKVVPVLK